ncbi:hypothetical protein C8R46DRAFT_364672 [Mycena filopes]|nr:hypothetical protein C8R46DRAFT_364672 [Mycena filopes]
MSDTPPPPKPKPGSLRDRIAAFEKPSTARKSAPAPPPLRPKPAGAVSWKPKPPSPPADNATFAAGTETEGGAVKSGGVGGMSASDAKESIGRGGSLKDRMAALQGRGAFGAPAAPAAPVVGTGKKWVPPPKPAVEEEEEVVVAIPTRARVHDGEDKAEETPKEGDAEEKDKPEGEADGEAEADPEEEERQRRAAIAARMARLGGARVGMSPPIFGPKPVIKKRPSEDSQSAKSPPSEDTPASPPIPATSPEISTSSPTLPPVVAPAAGTSRRRTRYPLLHPRCSSYTFRALFPLLVFLPSCYNSVSSLYDIPASDYFDSPTLLSVTPRI